MVLGYSNAIDPVYVITEEYGRYYIEMKLSNGGEPALRWLDKKYIGTKMQKSSTFLHGRVISF